MCRSKSASFCHFLKLFFYRLRIEKTVMMRSLTATDHGGKNVLCPPFPKVTLLIFFMNLKMTF